MCDRVSTHPTTHRVLIIQHPQEQDVLLGTAELVTASLPSAKLAIGLSFRNLAHALGEDEVERARWALLFPKKQSTDQDDEGEARAADPGALEGVVVLDGTWSQAKTLYWRNPWLRKLPRLSLTPGEPSIYGKLRKEPRRECVSTLESVAAALTLMGEPPELEASLRRLMRTLVQRARDAKLSADAPRLAKKKRA